MSKARKLRNNRFDNFYDDFSSKPIQKVYNSKQENDGMTTLKYFNDKLRVSKSAKSHNKDLIKF